MHLEAAREEGIRGLDVRAGTTHPPPAERIDDQRCANVATIGLDREAGASVYLRRLELNRALRREQPTQRPVVECRKRPWQPVARGGVRRVDHELAERLLRGAMQLQRLEPGGRR